MAEELEKRIGDLEVRVNAILYLKASGSMESHYWSHLLLKEESQRNNKRLQKMEIQLEELRKALLRLGSEPELHNLIK